MPSAVVKNIAKKTGKSEKEVEKLWTKAKEIAKKEYDVNEDSDNFYAIVTGILKKMVGLKESFEELIAQEHALFEMMMKKKKKKVKEEMEDEDEEDEEDEKKKKKHMDDMEDEDMEDEEHMM